jgi:SPP1 family phage portal protein
VYDIVNSDFANNLDDFQDVYWILKNYGGEDLEEFQAQLKRYKTIKVGDDGDATSDTTEIPTEARKVMLDIIEKNIYKFGMALNYDSITGQTTATEIQARTANLELKVNQFEKQYFILLEQIEYFVNKHNEFNNKPPIEPIEVTFNRTSIINKAEEVENLNKLWGKLSHKTWIKLLPYDIDVDEEIAEIEKENEKMRGMIQTLENNE